MSTSSFGFNASPRRRESNIRHAVALQMGLVNGNVNVNNFLAVSI